MKPIFIKQDIIIQGIIEGMSEMGASFDKVDDTHFYFTINKGSEIDNNDKLVRSKDIFKEMYGRGLKVRRV